MFGIRVFAIGLLLGLASGVFITHFHVLRTADGFDVVPRVNQPPLRSSYCDVREWSTAMWANHPEVTAALTANGRGKLIGKSIQDNLLEDVLPQVPTRKAAPVIDSSVARRPVPMQTESGDLHAEVTEMVAGNTTVGSQWLEQKSPLRQKWESIVDDAIAPIVEEEPAESSSTSNEVLPGPTVSDPLIQKLEQKFRGTQSKLPAFNTAPEPAQISLSPEPDGAQAVEEVASDLLRQVIPQGSQVPRGAIPLRDLSRDLLATP